MIRTFVNGTLMIAPLQLFLGLSCILPTVLEDVSGDRLFIWAFGLWAFALLAYGAGYQTRGWSFFLSVSGSSMWLMGGIGSFVAKLTRPNAFPGYGPVYIAFISLGVAVIIVLEGLSRSCITPPRPRIGTVHLD